MQEIQNEIYNPNHKTYRDMGKALYHFLYILGEVLLFYYLFWVGFSNCSQRRKYVPKAQRYASFTIETSPPL